MNPMLAKLATLGPEITLLTGACVCIVLGLWNQPRLRHLTPWAAGLSLLVAAALVGAGPRLGLSDAIGYVGFIKLAVCLVGLLLLLIATGLTDSLHQARDIASGQVAFDPGQVCGGEFFAFFLLSLTGVMLVAGAEDLIWLFLALELTSLPTYVMVAISRDRLAAREAAVKYFFLGALAAAVFLYGFTLIYGATGFTDLGEVRNFIAGLTARHQPLPPLLLTGLVLALVGVTFKIAAVPMHFYAADVYQGAATPVTAFLAFVPKTAGFVALITLLGLIWNTPGTTGTTGIAASAISNLQSQIASPVAPLPPVLSWLLVILAVATMTVGNVLGLLQSNVKRVLAYSSIAHSGYMLVGLVAGPAMLASGSAMGNGVAAILFYLVAYGVATIGAFAVLSCLQAKDEDAETFDDLSGLAHRHPGLAAIMLISVLSLIGLPPLAGFLGKVFLLGSVLTRSAGHPEYLWLVILAVLNSAVSAVYYLHIAATCFFGDPNEDTRALRAPLRVLGAALAAILALGLGLCGSYLINAAHLASAAR
jgi:NADH-quinone oxidoreductase subunit N